MCEELLKRLSYKAANYLAFHLELSNLAALHHRNISQLVHLGIVPNILNK